MGSFDVGLGEDPTSGDIAQRVDALLHFLQDLHLAVLGENSADASLATRVDLLNARLDEVGTKNDSGQAKLEEEGRYSYLAKRVDDVFAQLDGLQKQSGSSKLTSQIATRVDDVLEHLKDLHMAVFGDDGQDVSLAARVDVLRAQIDGILVDK